MIEADDTTPGTGDAPSKARGDGARAPASVGEAYGLPGANPDAPLAPGSTFASGSTFAPGSTFTGSSVPEASAAPEASSVAAARSTAAGGDVLDVPPEPQLEPLVLQPDFQAGDRSQYHVSELLAYHDRRFVESVYRAILGRAPFQAESARELDELRGGRTGKVEMIERLLASREARTSARRVRIEGLPSPAMRRLGRVPLIGYVLRLVRALARLPLFMQHQQQFEIYALAQQQLIADHLNRTLARLPHERAGDAPTTDAAPTPFVTMSQFEEMAETLAMFSDALIELSNSHAELQEQTQTQAEQAQAALAELTAALGAQQQLAETFRREQQLLADALRREQQLAADALGHEQQLAGDALRHGQQLLADALRREQQLAADAQREFLIQEQRVIVETQKVLLEDLREELRALSERQQRARDEFDAEVRRLRSLQAAASSPSRENFSGQA